jgi:tetratricopeptide (TPR) repeat protein
MGCQDERESCSRRSWNRTRAAKLLERDAPSLLPVLEISRCVCCGRASYSPVHSPWPTYAPPHLTLQCILLIRAQAAALKDQGNKAFAAKDYDKAIDLFTQAIAVDSANHVLYSNRSAALVGKKQWDDALEDANKVRG